MLKSKYVIPIVGLLLIVTNIYLSVNSSNYKLTTPAYDSAQGGIGVALQWVLAFLGTALICGIILIWIIRKEIKNKKSLAVSKESILHIIILGIALLSPFIFLM